VKAARFDYLRPASLQEALSALAASGPSARLIAGSQSLGPMLNLRLARPTLLIDIARLEALRSVTEFDQDLRIGAGVTHAEIEDGRYPLLRDHPWQRVAGTIAYRSVRNRGTVGGSLAHADPAADWMLVAWACDAQIEIARLAGSRLVPVSGFMKAAYTTVLAADEMIVAVRIPAALARADWGYYKVCRKVGDFAEASCAALFDARSGLARIVIGALDGPPLSLDSLARSVARDRCVPSDDAIAEALGSSPVASDAIARQMFTATVARAIARARGTEHHREAELA
jgi:carbon-monoxide dehydrogenase medium subunit